MTKKKNIIIVQKETMTVARYLSYITGMYFDRSENKNRDGSDDNVVKTETAALSDHYVLLPTGHEYKSDKKDFDVKNSSLNHKNIEIFVKNFIESSGRIEFVDLTDKTKVEIQELFSNTTNNIIMIPGIKIQITSSKNAKTSEDLNNTNQYVIKSNKSYDGEKIYNYVVIKSEYKKLLVNLDKWPGTTTKTFNYIRSYNVDLDNNYKSKTYYLSNVYKDSADLDYSPTSIEDFINKLDFDLLKDFKIDLFISHQSKDKEPYVDRFVKKYRQDNPQKFLWYDKDYFQRGIESNSQYARNTIAHGLLNTSKVIYLLSNNYLDKLLNNIEEGADYFGINYELALLYAMVNSNDSKLKEIDFHLSNFTFTEKEKKLCVFNFKKYEEIISEKDGSICLIDNIFDKKSIERYFKRESLCTNVNVFRAMIDWKNTFIK